MYVLLLVLPVEQSLWLAEEALLLSLELEAVTFREVEAEGTHGLKGEPDMANGTKRIKA